MKSKRLFTFSIFLLSVSLLCQQHTFGQEADTIADEYESEIRQMIGFIEYSFNALGNDELTASEKDVIINQSYLKVFRDASVQIEDDLDPTRVTVSNKDVQAYLKDIDFFFRNVKFDFQIEEVNRQLTEEGNLSYKVKMQRFIQGVVISGDSINNALPRFVEINVDEANKQLKIASIYTTKLNEKEELIAWWNSLDPDWKKVLGRSVVMSDTIAFSNVAEIQDSTVIIAGKEHLLLTDLTPALKAIQNLDSLILTNASQFNNFYPVSELTELKYIDLSGTGIVDLMPFRALTKIEHLDCSNTRVKNLDPIKYCLSLTHLDISGTRVDNIAQVANFTKLRELTMSETLIDDIKAVSMLTGLSKLDVSSTNVTDLSPLTELKQLSQLNLHNTFIDDATALSKVPSLKSLDISKTKLRDFTPLKGLTSLEHINVTDTKLNSLESLNGLSKLQRIEADHTEIDHEDAQQFLSVHPNCVLIYASDELSEWLDSLSAGWKKVLSSGFDTDKPGDEQLHYLLKIDSVNISGNQEITDLEPLRKLYSIRYLNCSETAVADLTPVQDKSALKILKCASTSISDLEPISSLKELHNVNFDNTNITSIEPLLHLTDLSEVSFNNTSISDISIIDSLKNLKTGYFENTGVTASHVSTLGYDPGITTIIFRSDELRSWWGNLEDEWQDVIKNYFELSSRPENIELHQITGTKTFKFSSLILADLSPIANFIKLESLDFHDTQITDLKPLSKVKTLISLNCSRNPITDIMAISSLDKLQTLNLDNTQIDDISPLALNTNLKSLKMSGTDVKDLSPLAGLKKLEVLECSNSKVRSLKGIEEMSSLKVLKCYNNKINSRRIDLFKEQNPDCEVVFY